jgi:hypothetical protein
MNPWIILLIGLSLSASSYGQGAYKCKTGGRVVIQNQPCHGAETKQAEVQSSSSAAAESSASETKARLARDKEYLARSAHERAKNEAHDKIQACEQDINQLQAALDQMVDSPSAELGTSTQSVMEMQLDEERRQTNIVGLQARIATRRSECDVLRKEAERISQPSTPSNP